MTYLEMLLIFLAAPILVLLGFVAFRAVHDAEMRKTPRISAPVLLTLTAISMLYTTPWDKWMIDRGVFYYPPPKIAAHVAGIPVEDLFLFALQGLLAGLWSVLFLGRLPRSAVRPAGARLAAVVVVGVLAVAEVVALLDGSGHTLYTASILTWFGPLLAIQYLAGADSLLAQWRSWLAAVVPLTAWLWVVEAVAIGQDVWRIDPASSLTWRPGGLPTEDFAIFLVGNLLVIQTFLFLGDPAMRARVRGWATAAASVLRRAPVLQESRRTTS